MVWKEALLILFDHRQRQEMAMPHSDFPTKAYNTHCVTQGD